jgi:hypothetical protein
VNQKCHPTPPDRLIHVSPGRYSCLAHIRHQTSHAGSESMSTTITSGMPAIVPPMLFPNPLFYQAIFQQENARIQLDGLRSVLLESYLNYTPVEFGLATEARLAIDEALIKGRGCLWTELYSPPGTPMKVVRSVWDSTGNLFVDPDAQSFETARWIARRCVHPVWQVERELNLRRGSIRGQSESQRRQADVETSDDALYMRKQGKTADLITYWKIWSKMGMGGRLLGINEEYRDPLEMFDDYCYLVVAENTPFFLHLSPDVVNAPGFSTNPRRYSAGSPGPRPTGPRPGRSACSTSMPCTARPGRWPTRRPRWAS